MSLIPKNSRPLTRLRSTPRFKPVKKNESNASIKKVLISDSLDSSEESEISPTKIKIPQTQDINKTLPLPTEPDPQDIFDTTKSNAERFNKLVKQYASYFVRLIAVQHPDCKDLMFEGYNTFFNRFNKWIREHGLVSLRKLEEDGQFSLSDLQETEKVAKQNLNSLADENVTWNLPLLQKNGIVSPIITQSSQPSTSTYVDITHDHDPIDCFISVFNSIDYLNGFIQNLENDVHEIRRDKKEIVNKFNVEIEVDYKEQRKILGKSIQRGVGILA